ncbi:hypothetical protein ACIA9I_34365 [Streptomyces anulatus]
MFLARDEDDTPVMIRLASELHVADPTAALSLVRTEAECLLRMAGTYVPSLIDVGIGTVDQPPWLAATCVHRRTGDVSSGPAPNLRVVLDEYGGTVPEELFLRIGLALSQALARAHGLGIVHGSLAPRYVLVSDQDVRLIGWATATLDGIDSPYRDELPTNQEYLNADDDGPALTPRSDVHAAGALLLAFLAGEWGDPRAEDKTWNGAYWRRPASIRSSSGRCGAVCSATPLSGRPPPTWPARRAGTQPRSAAGRHRGGAGLCLFAVRPGATGLEGLGGEPQQPRRALGRSGTS